MERIYHPYWSWEDHSNGFYDSFSGKTKNKLKEKVVEMFSNPKETEIQMRRVISLWKNSCEHNLTNPSMNKIAYIGQSACCLYANIPSTITMEAWSEVPKEHQEAANKIAYNILNEWINNEKTKQLCLKLD